MNPYENLREDAFWKPAVASKHMLDITGLWAPKFHVLPSDKVATYGSCFAQHIGRSLRERNYSWLISERNPFGMGAENLKKFNYEIFTTRTGNIYTTSLLKQWIEWGCEITPVPEEIWEQEGRFFDPFRPAIEPNGFCSREELLECRDCTVKSFRRSVIDAKYFVFTLGLTEHWVNSQLSYEYPMCPGTVAGSFDGAVHEFRNHDYTAVRDHLMDAIAMMRNVNPDLKFILTVSPVPLTATMSGKHVLVATMHSKSILRAVAGQLAAEFDHIDYFPSYEIINSPAFRGAFFEPNLRNVHPNGVAFVMDSFFACLHGTYGAPPNLHPKTARQQRLRDEVCEEEILNAFVSK